MLLTGLTEKLTAVSPLTRAVQLLRRKVTLRVYSTTKTCATSIPGMAQPQMYRREMRRTQHAQRSVHHVEERETMRWRRGRVPLTRVPTGDVQGHSIRFPPFPRHAQNHPAVSVHGLANEQHYHACMSTLVLVLHYSVDNASGSPPTSGP
jgi:hypothetical protein